MKSAGCEVLRNSAFDPLARPAKLAGWLAILWAGALPAFTAPVWPTIEVKTNHTIIAHSCQVVIPAGAIIEDPANLGAIEIAASNIEIEFSSGSVLRGSPPGTAPDLYKGYGIRLNGHRGVRIRGARISGFWCGLYACKADGLRIENLDASDNRRARLKSTTAAEDSGDWLFAHDNDKGEWLSRYGSAIYIHQSAGVTVRDSRVWHGQNALCLDRVTDSRIYDNDFSFNSGWGIALWRSSRNAISRNALDFCVRGYSHGVYNRGQDSAGILAFEQNNDNIFVENSVTHGGDGFFGFAGREALGETGDHPIKWYRRRGNSDNLLVRNDFSYAAAHGIENTFSFRNCYLQNRIVGNAICGIWAGYSRESLIAGNYIEANGDMGYGLERGGVNFDHGGDNAILGNLFLTNQCGVHLWGGLNHEFETKNWAKVNGYSSTGSVVAGNAFRGDRVAFHFRGPGEVSLGSNELSGVATEIIGDPSYKVRRDNYLALPQSKMPALSILGRKHPVGARSELRGRENIIMNEWGPWDHVAPLVRLINSAGGAAVYEILKVPADKARIEVVGEDVQGALMSTPGEADKCRVTVTAVTPGVRPYVLKVFSDGEPLTDVPGTLVAAKWETTFFRWPASIDPREHLEAYRKLSAGPNAVSSVVDELSFKFGMRGPSALGISDKIAAAKLGPDHFGLIAKTRLPLAPGTWEFTTESDDGVRVTVDGKPIIDNWTWHGPTRDSGSLTLEAGRVVEIVVEYFQIDGFAVLEFSLARQPRPPPSAR